MSDETIIGVMRDGIFRANQLAPNFNPVKAGEPGVWIPMEDATKFAHAALLRLRQEGFDVVRTDANRT